MRVILVDPNHKTNYLHKHVVFCALHEVFKLIQTNNDPGHNKFSLMLAHAAFELYCTTIILKRVCKFVPTNELQCIELCACVSIAYKLLTDDDCIQYLYDQLYNYISSHFLSTSKRVKILQFQNESCTMISDKEWEIGVLVRWNFFPITKESYEFYSSKEKTIESCSTLADNDLYELLTIIEC